MRTTKQKKTIVLIVALAAAAVMGVLCWQYVPGLIAWLADPEAVRAFVDEQAVLSRVAMVGINVLQIVLAFLPGEPIELASGYAFGFWEGTVLCLIASGLGTSLIYWAVRRWGWRVVGLFFSRETFNRFAWLQDTARLELVMFLVFLVPGTPKDFLTYFAGLTSMRFLPVLLIATLGRIPSIVTSTIAASAVGDGNWTAAIIAVVVSAVLIAAGGTLYRVVQKRATRGLGAAGNKEVRHGAKKRGSLSGNLTLIREDLRA